MVLIWLKSEGWNNELIWKLCSGFEAVSRRCSVKKVFSEISQNSRENTCARDSLNKVAGLVRICPHSDWMQRDTEYLCGVSLSIQSECWKIRTRPATFQQESLAQVFSCEFCEISKSTFFYRTPLVAAFGYTNADLEISLLACFQINTIRRKFRFFNPKNSRVI